MKLLLENQWNQEHNAFADNFFQFKKYFKKYF